MIMASMEDAKQPSSSDRRCLAGMWREIQGSNNWKGLLHPTINPILKQEIIKYGEFAQLCYDFFDCDRYSKYYGTCKYGPKKLFQQAEIHSQGYEISKFIYASTQVQLPTLFLRSMAPDTWSHDSTWMGFIAVVTDNTEVERMGRRDIVVTWRGTETMLEWIEDLQGWLVPFTLKEARGHENGRNSENKPVMVESGFLSVYSKDSQYSHMSARDLVLAEIERLLEQHRGEEVSITLCGHSLGAALALLCAYDLGHMVSFRSPRVVVTVFTFGCPRVGNKLFARNLQELNVRVLRVVNVNDVVPRVPGMMMKECRLGNFLRAILGVLFADWVQPWIYSHVGVQMTVDNSLSPFLKPTRNPVSLHNLEVYLHLVDGCGGEGRRDPALVNKFCDMLIHELMIPPCWWQEGYKGLVKNEKGRWTQRPRENDEAVPHPLYSQLASTRFRCSESICVLGIEKPQDQ